MYCFLPSTLLLPIQEKISWINHWKELIFQFGYSLSHQEKIFFLIKHKIKKKKKKIQIFIKIYYREKKAFVSSQIDPFLQISFEIYFNVRMQCSSKQKAHIPFILKIFFL